MYSSNVFYSPWLKVIEDMAIRSDVPALAMEEVCYQVLNLVADKFLAIFRSYF